MNGFSCHTRVFSGADALEYLATQRYARVLVVTDSFFSENGTARAIGTRVPGAAVEVFGEVQPDPHLALVARGVAAMQSFSPDCLIALGGGSAIDCAKAMRHCVDAPLPLIAIPTTSGTGSEVTTFAVITNGERKLALVDDALAPDVALLDASLLATLPPALIADAGFDLISHCVEAYCANGASHCSRALAAGALRTALTLLPRSYAGEIEVRGALHEASCAAGIAFNSAGLGACHALSHALGGKFHIAHGRLNAVLLPHVIECNASAALAQYGELAVCCGLSGATDTLRLRSLLAALRRVRAELHLPQTLPQAGIDPDALAPVIPAIAAAAAEDRCLSGNPMPLDEAALGAIVRAAMR